MKTLTCIEDGCEGNAWKRRNSNKKCDEHNLADLRARFGDVTIPKPGSRQRAVNKFWANVVTGEGCWEWLGTTTLGYGRVSLHGKSVPAHRFSYELAYGEIADGMFIDHLCHNRACTNPEHLREVTPKENTEHRQGANPNNTSGRHGVSWRKDIQKWHALVHCGDKGYHAGYYDDLDEAAEAARLKRNELFTHNNKDRRTA